MRILTAIVLISRWIILVASFVLFFIPTTQSFTTTYSSWIPTTFTSIRSRSRSSSSRTTLLSSTPSSDKDSNSSSSNEIITSQTKETKYQQPQTATTTTTATIQSHEDFDWNLLSNRLLLELNEIFSCSSLAFQYLFQDYQKVQVDQIIQICDLIDEIQSNNLSTTTSKDALIVEKLNLRAQSLAFSRYQLLVQLMKKDYDAYVTTASFLSPSRIARCDLPNVQDIPYITMSEQQENQKKKNNREVSTPMEVDGSPLVEDCTLEKKTFDDNILDKLLLSIFRKLVTKNTNGITSPKPGIDGLLEQGRTFMLQPNQTPENQHKMVYDTLGGLMTPVLPPFYRIFMSGIVPNNLGTPMDGKQFGPWFYAPWLTTIVTPTFFGFLVGPSYPNRRKDGSRGGLVVEKCKFLQESGCKGLCLNQCKLPAQQFFKQELGLDLTVSPNFETQECQWSFGEVPLPPEDDPSFPRGCLVGCESRVALSQRKSTESIGLCL